MEVFRDRNKEVKRIKLFKGRQGLFIRQITSTVLTKKFQVHWFKIPLLGETDIAIRLGITS